LTSSGGIVPSRYCVGEPRRWFEEGSSRKELYIGRIPKRRNRWPGFARESSEVPIAARSWRS